MTIDNPQDSIAPADAVLSVTLPQPIVDSAIGSDLVFTGLDIDGRAIPIRYLQTLGYPNTDDPNVLVYGVTIGYDGNVGDTEYLNLISSTFTPPIITTFTPEQPQQNDDDPAYYLFDYEKARLMLENAINQALANATFLPVNDYYVNVLYNAVTGLFTMRGSPSLIGNSNALDDTNIQIWFNTELASMFGAFPNTVRGYNTLDGRDIQYLFYDTGNNIVPETGECDIIQQYNGDSTMQICSRVYIVSSTTSILRQMNIINSLGDGQGNGLLFNIVAEFMVFKEDRNGSIQSRIQYVPTGEFQRRTLDQHEPMNQLDYRIYWVGSRPNIFRAVRNIPGNFSTVTFFIEDPVKKLEY